MAHRSDNVAANGVDLFISYSSLDAGRVLFIANQLQQAGISVWIDRNKIPGGAVYGPEIVRGIKQCRMFALMCSDAAVRSRNVNQEVLLAWKYQKPCLPLLLAPISFPEQIEYWVEGRQWVEILEHPPEMWLQRVQQTLKLLANSSLPSQPNNHQTNEDSQQPFRGLGARQSEPLLATPTPPAVVKLIPHRGGLSELFSLASFTDRIWPLPAESINAGGRVFRGLGAPQDHARHKHHIGSQVSLAIESDREGHLLLLDQGPEEIVYCLCPSWFAPSARLHVGRSYLPQPGSKYQSFVVTGRPGRERLLAIITNQPLGFDWLPTHESQTPARVLNQNDIDMLLSRLLDLEANEWAALSTYFEIIE